MDGLDDGIGARVALIRKRWGMSQQRLAMEAHVSKSLLSKVEAGWRRNPRPSPRRSREHSVWTLPS